MSQNIVIFDIDDTIRDAEGRYEIREEILQLTERKKAVEKKSEEYISLDKEIQKKWKVFFEEGFNDKPMKETIALCNLFYDNGFKVLFRTGASEEFKDKTLEYFKKHNIKFTDLKMRKVNVRIPDYRLKPAWVAKYDNVDDIFMIYDDREQVNEGYRSKGVKNTFLVKKDFSLKEHLKYLKDEFGLVLKEKNKLRNKNRI